MPLALDAAIEAIHDAGLPYYEVYQMRCRAYEAALDATGGDKSTAQSVVQDAVNAYFEGGG